MALSFRYLRNSVIDKKFVGRAHIEKKKKKNWLILKGIVWKSEPYLLPSYPQTKYTHAFNSQDLSSLNKDVNCLHTNTFHEKWHKYHYTM